MNTFTILCVDDERQVLLTLRTQLQRHFPECTIEIAEGAVEALEVIEELLAKRVEVPLVIADQIMTGMKGDQLLIELHRRHPQIVKVMLTGQATAEEVGNVVNRGNLYRFLNKPWNEIDLQLTVSEALRRYQQDQQLAQQQAALAQANQELETLNLDLEQQVQERTESLLQEIQRRQLTEDALRASEARYRLLSEISPVGIFRNDLQGHCTYANAKTLEMTGLSFSENLGEGWGRYLHPDDQEQMYRAWSDFVRQIHAGQEAEYQVEQRYLHPDGSLKWAFTQAVPERNAAGELVGFIGSIIDITDRKQAELALHGALEFNQQVIATAQEGIIVWDCDLRYRVWNRFMEDLSGIPAEQVLGQYCLDLFPFLKENGIFALLERALAGETVDAPDAFFSLASTDRSGWTAERFTPLRDEQGRITGVLGTVHDITQRKQTEAALSRSQARLANAQRIAHLGNWEFDLATQKISWSEELFRIFGLDPVQNEPTYAAFQQQVHPDDWPILQAAIDRAIADGTPYEVEHRIFYQDGSIRYILGRGEAVFNTQNQIVKLVGTGVDQTSAKLAEASLRESEERNRAILSAIPDLMTVINAEGQYLSFSFNAFSGESLVPNEEDLVGRDVFEVLPSNLAVLCFTGVQQALQTGQIQTYEQEVLFGHRIQYEEVRIVPYQTDKVLCMVRDITARKQAEQALRASERKYHQILDAMTDMVVVKAPDFRIVWGNQAFRDYYGMTLEDLEGIIDASFNQPDYTAQYLRDDAFVFETGQQLHIAEEPVTRHDGIVRTFSTIKAPIFDDGGQITMLVAVCRDITEQKQVETEFRENQQQLEAIAANVPGGVFRFIYHADGSHSCPFASEGYRTLFGIDPEELKTRPHINLAMVHPEDRETYEAAAAAAISGQATSFQGEVRYILPTGEIKWISTIAQLNRLENGDLIVDGIDIDITYRKQLESDLLKREAFLNSIYNAVAVAITVIDVEPDGTFRYIDFNPTCEQLSGIDFNQLRGKTLDDLSPLISIPELAALRTQFQHCVATGESIYLETELTINGQREWWLSQHAPLKDETGQVYRLVGTAIPITERKQAEAQLEAQNQLLARIARSEPLTEVLQTVILQLERQLPGAIGSILLLDETNRLCSGAAPNLPPTFVQAIDGIQIGERVGSCGTAAYLKQMIVVPDITIDPRWESFKDLTLAHGLQACWSTPIIAVDGRVLGTFAVYYREVQSPTANALAIIHQLANIVGIAIERDLAETKIRQSQEQLELTLDFTGIGAWNWHPVTGDYAWNGKMAELLELPLGLDNMFQLWCDHMHPDDVEYVQASIRQALTTQNSFTCEYRYHLQDDRWVWRWVKGQGIYTDTGEIRRVLGVVQDITERKQAEEALRASEAQYRRIVETANEGIWILDAENRTNFVNPKLAEILGYHPDEMFGRPLFDFMDEDGIALATQNLERRRQGITEQHDFKFKHKNGEDVWAWVSTNPILDAAAGQYLGTLGMITDITARKRAEQALQQLNEELELRVQQRTQALLNSQTQLQAKEQFLRGIFEGTENPIFVIDVLEDGTFQYTGWNHASEIILGVWSRDALGKSPPEIFGTDIGSIIEQNYRRCCETGEVVRYEEYLAFGDRNAWTLTTLNPLNDAEGRIYRIVGNALDITERKQFEEVLRQKEEQYRTIFEAVMDGIFINDLETGELVEVNPSACRMHGYTREEMLQLSPSDYVHPNYLERFEVYLQTLSAGEIFFQEAADIHKNGTVFDVEVVGSPFLFNGKPYALGVVRDISERKQTEIALREAQRFAQSIADNIPNIIYIYDITRNQNIYANREISKILGYSVEAVQAMGRRFLETTVHPEDLVRLAQTTEQIRNSAEGEIFEIEYRMQAADGTWRWLHDRVSAFKRDAAGRVIQHIGAVQDITDRKLAEAALAEKNAILQSVIESTPDIIFVKDAAGQLVIANSGFAQFFNQPLNQLLGKIDIELWPIETALRLREEDQRIMQTGMSRSLEEIMARPDGRQQTYLTTKSPWYDAQGNVIGIIGLARDISEQKQAEIALQEAQQFAQSIADKTPAALYIYDLVNQCNRYSNRSIIDLLGYTQEEILAMGTEVMPTLLHPEDVEKIAQHHQALLMADDGVDLEVEYRMRHANGDWRWFYSRDSVFKRDAEGNVIQYIGAAQNITERKHLEQDLRQINADLEQRVADRTQDLQHAMEAAQAANHAKTTFLANMSHELRTPLNAILGFSQLLNRADNLTPMQQEQLDIINRSGEHLLTLINDILAMSKIEAGRITLTINRFNLRELLSDLEAIFRLKAEAKQLRLTLQMSSRVPQFIQTDEGKLRQVLINLLSNAIKFTTQGSVTLRIWQEEPAMAQDGYPSADSYPVRLHFEVADTGCGIDLAEQAIVFEPFGQTRAGRNSQEGTGLGLPISRQFVQLMGGELQFTSTPNQGTQFRFTIQVEGFHLEETPANSLESRVVGLAADQPRYRLLIVEDNPENQQFLVQLLGAVGFEIQTAINGQEAVEIWQTWHPDLIWMDMRMPVLDGYAATQQIRSLEQQSQNPQSSATKILALTASAFEDERAAILAAGCDDFLFKPITEAILFEKMAQHLGVRYLYQDQIILQTTSSTSGDESIQQKLQKMPPEWIARLRFAARTADEDAILELIDQLPSTEADLVNTLRDLVDELQIEKLIELTETDSEAASE